tara:strand:+ start:8601 stop:10289 length:1689 start_codon:yes stop_codon:yes gene_type:complete
MATPTLQSFGNNLVVKKADYRFAGNFTDENKLTNLFGYDNLKGENYLGIFSVFNQWSLVNTPLLKRSIMEKNIIYTNGNVDYLTFDMPYRLEGITIKSDLTEDIAKPGIDGSWFEIHLGDGGLDSVLQVGDRIGADYYDGQNLMVVEVGVRFGLGFKYKVKLVTDDKYEYFNKRELAVGTQFFKIGHSANEFSEDGSGLSQGFGLMKLQHRLGGRRMLEYTITGDAQRLELAGVAKVGSFEFDLSTLNKYGDLSDAMNGGYMVTGQNAGNGKIKKGTMSWVPFIEVMLHNELARLEELDLTFAQGGTVTLTGAGGRNITIPVGQGLYQQMKKGNWRTFPKYSREAVIDTFNQAFRNRPDIPDYQRKFKLEGGRGAVQEFQRIFNEELNRTANQSGAVMQAADLGIVKKVGEVNGISQLKSGYIMNEVFISGVGVITIEHNPAFDAIQSRVMDQPEIGGLPKRSYTAAIFDLTDENSTNAAKMSPDVEFAKGMDTGANIYLVKNKKFPGTKISYVNGRTSPYPVSAGSGQAISSRFDGFTQLLENQSNIFLKDPTRSILLELK